MNSFPIALNPLLPESFFRRFSGHSLRQALFVYRLIGATRIGNILMIPSEIEIKILALRSMFGALGSKGLKDLRKPVEMSHSK